MCVLGSEPPPPALHKRLRLWELPPSLHCAILGTCLGFADLVKTGRKAGIAPEPDATDYEVHAWFVQRSCEPGNLSRLLHKRLDRSWRSAVEAARAARDEAGLAAFWTRSVAKGDIPGPFWALMTHPAATEDLRSRAYGDVHMLSHRMGTANPGRVATPPGRGGGARRPVRQAGGCHAAARMPCAGERGAARPAADRRNRGGRAGLRRSPAGRIRKRRPLPRPAEREGRARSGAGRGEAVPRRRDAAQPGPGSANARVCAGPAKIPPPG